MINNKVLETLEYFKVLDYISKYIHTVSGKEHLYSLKPLSDKDEILRRGNYISEAKDILINNDIPPFIFLPDLFETLSRSTIDGSILFKKDIIDILRLAESSRLIRSFMAKRQETSIYQNLAQNLFSERNLENEINNVFTESGDIKDGASKELKEIRSEINSKTESLRKIINQVLKKLSETSIVQEEYTTQRDGRFVVPVKAEYKRQVRGFIHSESATGQTVYIEPEETLHLNNEILTLHFAEKREIERILKKLTQKISVYSFELVQSLRIISQLDVYFAAAKYSIEIQGDFPEFNEKKNFRLIDARHPLLLKKLGRQKTIPLNLDFKKNIVLITGPNAGGKTVVLKTTGLLLALVYTGFHISAHIDSNIHIFDKILLDIGDQQSIEDDLSTFSSHLKNIKYILTEADSDSIVLLDEIGTGTDPAEGSALAASLLLNLLEKKSKVLATTHHGSLKIMANETGGFENASMEYDTENLVPTYRFIQGMPGSSYAFEVARRLGFDNEFLDLAKNYLDTDKNKVEEFLIDLEKKSHILKSKLYEAEIENSKLKGLTSLYQQKIEKLESQKKKIVAETQAQAESYLKEVNKKIENAIKNIKESNASGDIVKQEKNIINELKKKNEELRKETHKEQIIVAENFVIGDYVSVKETTTSGTIIELDTAKNRAVISSGSIKLQVKINQLVKEKKSDNELKREYGIEYTNNYLTTSLDIRGKKPEEIDFELIRFLDDSYVAGLQKIDIIHGKGTGLLKKAVHEILKKHEHVAAYYFAKIEMGGEGLTVAELK